MASCWAPGIWLGFVLATHLPLWAYENRPLKLIAINAGSNLVSLVLMGARLGRTLALGRSAGHASALVDPPARPSGGEHIDVDRRGRRASQMLHAGP